VTLRSNDSGPLGARPLDTMLQASSGQMPAGSWTRPRRARSCGWRSRPWRAQRLAVLLSKFEGMSYGDIAEVMETTPPAVKSLLSRARENLREVLQPISSTALVPCWRFMKTMNE